MSHRVKILACSASDKLANEIANKYGQSIAEYERQSFSDGEFQISINETVRGCDVFIIQSTIPPADNLMEMLLMIDAAKRASAHKIIAVIPYFGWARQDRKDKPRVAIGAKLVANMLVSAGVGWLSMVFSSCSLVFRASQVGWHFAKSHSLRYLLFL